MKVNKTGAQTVATNIGKSGCLLLSYIRLMYFLEGKEVTDAELLAKASKYYDVMIKNRAIDWDCYVNDPVRLIWIALGKRVNVIKADTIPEDAPEYVVAYNGIHFVIVHKSGQIVWDSFGDSHIKITEKTPAINYRIVREV